MIISISGKIGSGKDTLASIIPVLVYLKEHENAGGKTEHIINPENWTWEKIVNGGHVNFKGDFQNKKFADKLKDITCMLLGCTREKLEDRDYKESELGQEWWYWKVYTDITNNKFVTYPYNKETSVYQLGTLPGEYSGSILVKPTPRLLLQLLGTECGRDILHPNIWVNSLMSDYKGVATNWDADGVTTVEQFPNWIITDCRFPNELQAVKERKGITIRVKRGTPAEGINVHPSETALDNAIFDYEIDNNGTLEELVEKVKEILKKENII